MPNGVLLAQRHSPDVSILACCAEWQKGLEEYRRSRPDLRVIDSYAAIRQLTDREAMLSKVGPEGIVLMVSPHCSSAQS